MPAVAHGHAGHAGDRVVVDAIAPAPEGVTVRAVPGGPGKLRLSTRGSTMATVLGSAGQPLLRSGPEGVEANLAAPEWYTDNEPLGIAQVPAGAGARRPARWQRVATGRAWEWFDHRLHPATGVTRRWTVPLRVGDRTVRVRGHVERDRGALQLALADPEPLPGVRVDAFSAPGLSLRATATGDRPVTVTGPGGELFGRVSARGSEVNVHSAAWLPTAQYANRDLSADVIDPRAQPRLIAYRREAALTWADPRLVPATLPPSPTAGAPAVIVQRWRIPIRVGDRRGAITGTTRLAGPPPKAETPSPPPTPTDAAPGAEADAGFDWLWLGLAGLAAGLIAGGWRLARFGRSR